MIWGIQCLRNKFKYPIIFFKIIIFKVFLKINLSTFGKSVQIRLTDKFNNVLEQCGSQNKFLLLLHGINIIKMSVHPFSETGYAVQGGGESGAKDGAPTHGSAHSHHLRSG